MRKEQQERESEEIETQEEVTDPVKKQKVDKGCVCMVCFPPLQTSAAGLILLPTMTHSSDTQSVY